MKLILDDEQQELAAMVRRLLADQSDSAAVRIHMDSPDGFDRALWKTFGELGLLGLAVPERFGGAEAGHRYRALVLTELGRAAVPSPFIASAVFATDALVSIGDEEANADLIPGLMDGSKLASLAIAEQGQDWPASGGSVRAVECDGQWVLEGTKTRVLYAEVADFLIVQARTDDGTAWFTVEAESVQSSPQETYDPTSRASDVVFAGSPARRLQSPASEAAAIEIRDLAAVALAALAIGGYEQVLDATVDYAKNRMQFGRAIGSYQAVKHGLADMYCRWELGLSLVRFAAWAADESHDELALAARSAAVYVAPGYFHAARESIQFHGGIGFTWEHDAHLHFKRARATQLMLGSDAVRRRELATALGH